MGKIKGRLRKIGWKREIFGWRISGRLNDDKHSSLRGRR